MPQILVRCHAESTQDLVAVALPAPYAQAAVPLNPVLHPGQEIAFVVGGGPNVPVTAYFGDEFQITVSQPVRPPPNPPALYVFQH